MQFVHILITLFLLNKTTALIAKTTDYSPLIAKEFLFKENLVVENIHRETGVIKAIGKRTEGKVYVCQFQAKN